MKWDIDSLEKRISRLEEKANEFDKLKEKYDELSQLVEFLAKHDKDDVVICHKVVNWSFKQYAKFIKNEKLVRVAFPDYTNGLIHTIKNTEENAIFKNGYMGATTYYVLDKRAETLAEMHDISLIDDIVDDKKEVVAKKEQKPKAKKTTTNKKKTK